MAGGEDFGGYAQLPDELIEDIIKDVPNTVMHASRFTSINKTVLEDARTVLLENDLVRLVPGGELTDSIVAVDGGYAVERLADVDLALVQAAGVEGISKSPSTEWDGGNQQYVSWQYALSHNIANDTLVRGIMSLLELSVLAGSSHKVKLLDGSHISQVISINKLFSANKESADHSFVSTFQDFLHEHFNGDIYKIADVVSQAINDPAIIASTKYSASRAAIDSFLSHLPIAANDKALFGKILKAGEYLRPQVIHSGNQDSTSWSATHLKYDIPLEDVDHEKFEWLINEAIGPMRTRDMYNNQKQSNLCYTYYRPYEEGPVYRLEIKQSLASDTEHLEYILRSIKEQVIYPDIIEPYPQFLADIVAKSVSKGLQAVKEAVVLSKQDDDDALESIMILRGYRT